MNNTFREPPSERGVAAVSRRDGILVPASFFPCRASQADMEMIIMSVIGADLGEPRPIALRVPAQGFLDRRVDENALYRRVLGGRFDDRDMVGRPFRRIDVQPVVTYHVGRRHFLS